MADFFRTKRATAPLSERSATLELDDRTALTRSEHIAAQRQLLDPGSRLGRGRYIIEDVLGSGGEGTVYSAHDTNRGERVAIKVLHLEDSSAIPQLKREFRFQRDLVHPGLVQLHELVVERTLSFFTMSFVLGSDFLTAAEDEVTLRKLIVQLAEVLDFLHASGRVHRDVKPSNLMVRRDGQLVLLDFGLGLRLNSRESEKRAVGTPRYMAPEVLAMRGASPKSDAYSVGILLYETLTAEHPNESGRTELAQAEPFDPRRVKPNLPEDLSELCLLLTHPDPDLRQSVDCILARLVARPRPSIQTGQSSDKPDAFSGRKVELEQLETAFRRVEEGFQPLVLCLEARSGMGKTALLQRFIDEQQDALVLRGRCSEHELSPHMAIDGVLEDLAAYLGELPEETQLDIIPEQDAAILLQLFPELCTLRSSSSHSGRMSGWGSYRAMRQRAYLALAGVLSRLAIEKPLIVAIDDVQWGDADSGRLLREVFFGSDRPACLLILAYRAEEKDSSPCLKKLFDSSRNAENVPIANVRLGPLSAIETEALLKDLLGDVDQATRDRIGRESAGSPLLITELAAHVRQAGTFLPEDERSAVIDHIVESRLGTVSAEAKKCFALLCCCGHRTELSFLAELVAAAPDALARQLETARLARSRQGGTMLFPVHDAIREAMLRKCDSDQPELHRVLGNALAQREGDPGEIARHFEACSDPRTTRYAELAAENASRSFALDQAALLYRLALSTYRGEPEHARHLRERLADALADAGRGAEAAPLYAELAKEVPVDHAIELQRRAAEQWLITGDAKRGTDALVEVQKKAGLRWPRTPRAALASLAYHRAMLSLMGEGAMESAMERAAARITSPSDPIHRKLAACQAAWSISMISTIHGAANSSKYARLALRSGDRGALGIGCAMEAMYHATAGPSRAEEVRRWLARSEALENPEDLHAAAFFKFALGQTKYLMGRFADSLDHFTDAESLFVKYGRNVAWELNASRIFWTDALFYLGRHIELDERFSRWISDGKQRGDRYIVSALMLARASRIVLKEDDVAHARDEAAEGGALWDAPYVSYHHLSEAVVQSYLNVYAGEASQACERMQTAISLMNRSHMNQVHVARVQVGNIEGLSYLEAAADLKPCSEKRHLLGRARVVAKRMLKEDAPWATALGLQFQAIANLTDRPTEAALDQLREAGRLFSEVGMNLHAAAVKARLGEVLGGDTGKDLLDEAYQAFDRERVQNWVQALSCHTPRVFAR